MSIPMEKIPNQHAEIPFDISPEVLHSWIVDELGDSELAGRVGTHPELTREFLEGESYPAPMFFEMVRGIDKVRPEITRPLVELAGDRDRLLPLSYDRVVGSHRGETQDKTLLMERFTATERMQKQKEHEREHTPEERAALGYVTDILNDLRAQYGLPEAVIDPGQIRMTDQSYTKENKSTGHINLLDQEAFIATGGRRGTSLYSTIFHELTHFMGYGAVQLDESPDGRTKFGEYRLGLSVADRNMDPARVNKKNYLTNVNEAVTEEIANRILASVPVDHPLLGAAMREHWDNLLEATEGDEDAFAESPLRLHWYKSLTRTENGRYRWTASYVSERVALFDLFQKMFERNTEHFAGKTSVQAEEELFAMLQKAMFTGNILPFGRLFNDTFGRGKFREYGHLQTNEEIAAFIAGL